MKTNIFKIVVVAILPVMIVGCHNGTAQTTEANGQDSLTSRGHDAVLKVDARRTDSGKTLRDTTHRNRDTVKP